MSLEVKEQLLFSYSRSLLQYFGTPLVAAKVWERKDIESVEKELYRELHLLPKDIDRDIIMNVAQNLEPVWHTIDRLAKNINTKRST